MEKKREDRMEEDRIELQMRGQDGRRYNRTAEDRMEEESTFWKQIGQDGRL